MYAPAYIMSLMTKPDIYKVGRLAAHSDHVCLDFMGKPLPKLSLCGKWSFEQYGSAGALCAAIASSGMPSGTVSVPGHLQLQGYGAAQQIGFDPFDDGTEQLEGILGIGVAAHRQHARCGVGGDGGRGLGPGNVQIVH